METINKKYYLPLLRNFYENTKDLYEESKYPYGPYIPYVFSNYSKAPVKILYCGLETYGWVKADDFLKYGEENRLEDYLDEDARTVTSATSLTWGNREGNFWPFVNRLHLMLRTGFYADDLSKIDDEQKKIISEIGYGNLQAMESPKTLNNEGFDIENWEAYSDMRKSAHAFESIKSMIDAYEPDYIIILTWRDSEATYDGLEFEWINSCYKKDFLSVYKIKGRKTKIIWTSHPRRFSFLSTNQKEMASMIYNSFDEIKSL